MENNIVITNLDKLLVFEEAIRLKRYPCPKGYPTIGVGHRIIGTDPAYYTTKGLKNNAEAIKLLKIDEANADAVARSYKWFFKLNEPRKAIIVSMIFQMGAKGFSEFKQLHKAIEAERWVAARNEMLDSKWANEDSPARARRHARQMLTGGWQDEYLKVKIIL